MNFLSVLYAKAGITVDGVTTLNNTATGQTPATSDNSTNIATTAFVKNQNYYPYPTGTTSQYVRGDGSLATFSQGGGGGGSSVNYYLNGSVSQGTIGGNTYYEMSKTAIIGTNADFSINADGYVAQFVTDAGDPALLNIPGGNWNFEMFFSASSGGGTPSFYVELYKYDGTTLTLIASGSTNPESITNGTTTDLYLTSLAVPTTTLTLTDRLAVRVYVTHSGRTITLHTQDSHLCQIITTFTTGLTALNGLTAQVQNFAVGTSGSDFAISSVTDTHTFNLPTASATKRGALSSIDWSAFDAKVDFGDLSATSPLSYNGSGVFSIAQSSTSTNGYLSSTDWTTFNNKQNALTNPITGTGTTNYLPKFTGASALGNSLVFDNGSNVGINTTGATYRFEANAGSSQYINARFYGSSHSLIQVESTTAGFQALLSFTSPTRTWSSGLQGDGRFNIYDNTANAERFSIATTGAATFGSSVAAGGLISAKDNAAYDAAFIEGANGIAYLGALGTASEIQLYNGGSTKVTIKPISGNVLIGTTTDAGYKLDVNGTARVATSLTAGDLISTSYGTARIQVTSTTNSANSALRFGAKNASGTNKNAGLYYVSGATSADTFMSFAADDTNYQFNFLANGFAGFGTTTPDSQLVLNGASFSRFNMRAGDVRYGTIYADSGVLAIASITAIPLVLGTNDIARLRIFANGNIGINTGGTDAGYKLDVNGTARVSGNLTATGNVSVGGTNQDSLLTINGSAGTSHARFREGSTTVGFVGGADGIISGQAGKLAIRGEAGLVLSGQGNSPDVVIASSGAATFSSSVTAGGNLLINNTSVSKKGYKFQSPSSNWSPQESGIFFTPADGVNAATTFSVELWDGNGNTTNALSIAPLGAAKFSSNIGWGGVTPTGDGTTSSTIEGANGAQIAARNGFAQLYISSNVSGTPYAATRSITGYAVQLSLDALGGTVSLNRAVSAAAGTAITWISNLGFDNTGAATFSSTITATNGIFNNAAGGSIVLKYGGTDDWVVGENAGAATRDFNIYNFNRSTIELSINRATGTATFAGRISTPVGWTTTGRNYSHEWIEFPNNSGLYSPINSAHFRPNDGSYGSWKIEGTRNGWGGLEFGNFGNGNISLMVYPGGNQTGFYNTTYGWQFLWNNGELQVSKNTYGGGYLYTVLDSANYTAYLAGYLPLSGGTITGDLTVNNKVYVGTNGCYFQEVLIGSVYELQVVDSVGNRTVLS